MQRESLFTFKDYKDYLKVRLSAEKSTRGLVSKMAEACGCQRSYLSQVIHGHVHLTPDHAFGLSRFWEMPSAETEYFLLLVDHARAASISLKKYIESKLSVLAKDHENLSKRLQRPRIEPGEKELVYYSSWHWSAIHILVSIPEFQTVKALSKKLQIPESSIDHCLKTLEEFGLVRFEKDRWIFSSGDLHLPKDSLLVSLHHQNWRQRALLDAQLRNEEGLHYTSVQTMSHRAFEQVKQVILDCIDESSKIAGPSKSEKMTCFGCDFFEV